MNVEKAAGETRAELADRLHDQIQQLPWDTTEEDTVLRGQWLRTNGDAILAALRVPAAPAALDVERLRVAARRARLPHDVTVADIENLAAEYAALAPSAGSSGTAEPFDEADDMCPNCLTPWKCNGPHLADQTALARRSMAEQPSHPAAPSIGEAE